MLRNYARSALRLLAREKFYVFINAAGLSVGMAAGFLIFSWVREEMSYDTFYPDDDRIYRVVTDWDGEEETGMATAYPMVRSRVLNQFPEVEASARLFNQGFLGSRTRISHDDKVLTNLRFFYGDSTVLSLFGWPVVSGEPRSALSRPNTVVLTRSTAAKFFGDGDPIGKTLRIGADREMEVTAVIEDLPGNSHIHFDVLATMLSHPWIKGAENNLWSGIVFHTYVKLRPGTTPGALQSNIARVLDNFPDDPEHIGKGLDLRLQPVGDIHLTSNRKFELEPNGSLTTVYLFITIAILVLAVAVINYINLSTARHTQRFREVGVRKVMGASRGQLVAQFMMESFGVSLLAFAGALLLSEIARPVLSDLAGRNVFSGSFLEARTLLIAASMAVIIAFTTAILPALSLSSFEPVFLFRPFVAGPARGWNLRKILMVFQFSVSILLTVCTAITYRQIEYLRGAALGYQTDHTVVLDISLPGVRESLSSLKQAFLSLPGVRGATTVSQLPTDIQTAENIDASPSLTQGVYCVSVDPDFFAVMGIPLEQTDPRLSALEPNDTVNRFVLNRSALMALGWTEEEAVGREISIRHGNQRPGPVLAIAEDFHFQSLHHAIAPLAIEFNPDLYQYLLVRLESTDVLGALAAEWDKGTGGLPFDYQFLDERYNRLYRGEQQTGDLFMAFSLIAILVSLLGLFGLASFTLERRTKEMGVRKILGAGAVQVAVLVAWDFLRLMGIAFAVALPLGFWFRERWLAQFAFHAEAGVGLFLAAALLNVTLALLTLLYHTVKISRTNPVDTLRYE